MDLDKPAAAGVAASVRPGDVGGDASPEADDDEYVPIADEIAGRIVDDLWELWKVRGLTDRYYGRLPRNLADALCKAYHDEGALVWARRIAAWAADAVERLGQEAGDA